MCPGVGVAKLNGEDRFTQRFEKIAPDCNYSRRGTHRRGGQCIATRCTSRVGQDAFGDGVDSSIGAYGLPIHKVDWRFRDFVRHAYPEAEFSPRLCAHVKIRQAFLFSLRGEPITRWQRIMQRYSCAEIDSIRDPCIQVCLPVAWKIPSPCSEIQPQEQKQHLTPLFSSQRRIDARWQGRPRSLTNQRQAEVIYTGLPAPLLISSSDLTKQRRPRSPTKLDRRSPRTLRSTRPYAFAFPRHAIDSHGFGHRAPHRQRQAPRPGHRRQAHRNPNSPSFLQHALSIPRLSEQQAPCPYPFHAHPVSRFDKLLVQSAP